MFLKKDTTFMFLKKDTIYVYIPYKATKETFAVNKLCDLLIKLSITPPIHWIVRG